jgi:hypothetical protein
MRVTEQTKAEAQNILDYLESFPAVHDQRVWAGVAGDEDFPAPDVDNIVIEPDKNYCNTTMCIAGAQRWLAQGPHGLNEFSFNEFAAQQKAADALGLDYGESQSLFYVMDNVYALDMLRAVASGDEEKFKAIREEWDEVEVQRARGE